MQQQENLLKCRRCSKPNPNRDRICQYCGLYLPTPSKEQELIVKKRLIWLISIVCLMASLGVWWDLQFFFPALLGGFKLVSCLRYPYGKP